MDFAVALTTACIAILVAVMFLGLWRRAVRAEPTHVGTVTTIVIFPLKSARGISVQSAKVGARGLEYDRLWMVVDGQGSFLSQRRSPRLATVDVQLPTSPDDSLRVSAPGAEPLVVPVLRQSTSSSARGVRVWDDRLSAVDQGDEAARWFASLLGVEGARLVRMADDVQRPLDRKYAPSGGETSFADGFPLLLASEASLADVNARLIQRGKRPVPMDRFRANLVMSGGNGEGGGAEGGGGGSAGEGSALRPFEEDTWEAIEVTRMRTRARTFTLTHPLAREAKPSRSPEPEPRRSRSHSPRPTD